MWGMEKLLSYFPKLLRSITAKRLITSSFLTAIAIAGDKMMALVSGIVLARLLGPEATESTPLPWPVSDC